MRSRRTPNAMAVPADQRLWDDQGMPPARSAAARAFARGRAATVLFRAVLLGAVLACGAVPLSACSNESAAVARRALAGPATAAARLQQPHQRPAKPERARLEQAARRHHLRDGGRRPPLPER
jgi:hypothetical protein